MPRASGALPTVAPAPLAAKPRLTTRLTDEFRIDYPSVNAGMGFVAVPERRRSLRVAAPG
jgi:hypothetical protein